MSEIDKHLLLIDNFDSFSYNIVELLRSISGIHFSVLKNNNPLILNDNYHGIIISPGPGLPSESGLLKSAIEHHHSKIPILGICLGLQAIVEFYGGKLKQLPTVFHGIRDKIKLLDERSESLLFKNIPYTFFAGRYHSWVGAQKDLPTALRPTALGSDGEIMAVEHAENQVYAVQFHPESYMTEHGLTMLQNFINLL